MKQEEKGLNCEIYSQLCSRVKNKTKTRQSPPPPKNPTQSPQLSFTVILCGEKNPVMPYFLSISSKTTTVANTGR